jgi:outer membrane protein TolC
VLDDLRERVSVGEARLAAGTVLRSNVEVLMVEILSVRQQRDEAASMRRSALGSLTRLIGIPLVEDVVLSVDAPSLEQDGEPVVERAELAVFDRGRQRLERMADLSARKYRPTVAAFAEGSVGRPPGQNFFDDSVSPFYSAGLRVTWAPWAWGNRNREAEQFTARGQILAIRREAFERDVLLAVAQVREEIGRIEEALVQDAEIVERRRRIVAESAARLDNGMITTQEYLADRAAATGAELRLEQRRIDLARARSRYAFLAGHTRP